MHLWEGCLVFIVYLSGVISQVDQRKARPVLVFDAPEIESYLGNERLINLQIKCLLSAGACDSLGRFIKVRLSKSLVGECESCTMQQSENMKKFLRFLNLKYPDTYSNLITKYFPIVPTSTTKKSTLNLQQASLEKTSFNPLFNYNDTLFNEIIMEMDNANKLNSYNSRIIKYEIPIISSK